MTLMMTNFGDHSRTVKTKSDSSVDQQPHSFGGMGGAVALGSKLKTSHLEAGQLPPPLRVPLTQGGGTGSSPSPPRNLHLLALGAAVLTVCSSAGGQ